MYKNSPKTDDGGDYILRQRSFWDVLGTSRLSKKLKMFKALELKKWVKLNCMVQYQKLKMEETLCLDQEDLEIILHIQIIQKVKETVRIKPKNQKIISN